MTRTSEVSLAVKRALFMGAAASAASVASLPAQAQDQQAAADEGEQTVVVTGSRIRRVDQETASPVFVLDNAQITSSGVATMGELMQRVPAIAGAATNPQVNNGGGTGESNVELRGLGAQRTLVLLNGRRIGIYGNTQTSAVDINMIPVNMIERVEVLKEGAGAVYGSDAIAGVVNFITRKNFDGVEVGSQFGQTSHSDGKTQQFSVLFGNTSDKGNLMLGANYNKQDAVSAADRDFSKFALYLYSGNVSKGGSSRTPNGRINLPSGNSFGCGSVTRLPGTSGGSLANYRCYNGATDAYNYQPFNLLMTPQERGNVFTSGNYQFNDSLEAYAEVLYSHTTSSFAIASLPFDAVADDIVISANSIYNPFGIDFGGVAGLNPNLRNRVEVLGQRQGHYTTDGATANTGLRGKVFETGWQWDLNAGLGHLKQNNNTEGYLLKPSLQNAVGPSFMLNGVPTCGTPTAIIANCTPINIFNVSDDPNTQALLSAISTNYRRDYTYRSSQYQLNFNGKVVDLPAGELSAAVGAEYREQEGSFATDILTRGTPPQFLSCLLSQETCTGNSFAKYGVREVYAEFLVPLLKDMPGVHSLVLNAGIRHSAYTKSTIGKSTNSEFKLEYRPIQDVLVRGSYAEVFRAPTINDLSLAPTQDSVTFTDPCEGITAASVAANPNLAAACQSVPLDGSFAEPLAQITGLLVGSPDLKPETGDVTTFGVVYDISQVPGLSFTVDYWKYKIDDLITSLDPNFAITQCTATGDPTLCGYVFRYGSATANPGQIQVFLEPTVNLGNLETDGVDIGSKYALRNTPVGNFQFSLDLTHINSYENTPTPGADPIQIAGTYDRQFGNYAKWRGLLGVGWAFRDFEGLMSARYIHKLEVLDPDGAPGVQDPLKIPSVTYFDLSLGYNFPTKTKVQIGVQNLTDKDPPILYMNNVSNANTDVSTYDTIGRRFFVGFTQTF